MAFACGSGVNVGGEGGDDTASGAGRPVGGNGNTISTGTNAGTDETTTSGDGNAAVGNGDGNAATGVALVPTRGTRETGPLVAAGTAGYYPLPMNGCSQGSYFVNLVANGNTFNVLVDSGSTMMALASSQCANCGAADRYNVSGGVQLAGNVNALYYDGSGWGGPVYRDLVALTYPPNKALALEMNFVAIERQQNDFLVTLNECVRDAANDYDGILGMGPDALLAGKTSSLTATLQAGGKLQRDAFALQTCDVGGNLLLGGYDASFAAEQPVFVPLSSRALQGGSNGATFASYYALDVVDMRVGASSVNLSTDKLGTIIVDNGAEAMLLATSMYNRLVAALIIDTNFRANFQNLISGKYVDCEVSRKGLSRAALDAALPKLAFSFRQADGALATVQMNATRSYLTPLRRRDGQICYTFAAHDSRTDDNNGSRILGAVGMRQHLFVFDRAGGRIGIAAQGRCDDALPDYLN